MKTNTPAPENNRLRMMLAAIPLVLLLAWISMQFTTEIKWTPLDFGMMGMMLLMTALLVEVVLKLVKKRVYRWVILSVILLALILLWAELAVGIFGSAIAGS